jgi:hypothetical protein
MLPDIFRRPLLSLWSAAASNSEPRLFPAVLQEASLKENKAATRRSTPKAPQVFCEVELAFMIFR